MPRQYGAPPTPENLRREQEKYGRGRRDQEPETKAPDKSPPNRTVEEFHKNASVDTRPEDIHHRLGNGQNQAAPGNHRHNGSDSEVLGEGIIITGSKGGNSALASVISAMVKILGVTDSTT